MSGMIFSQTILALCAAAAITLALVKGARFVNMRMREQHPLVLLLVATALVIRNFASEKSGETNVVLTADSWQHVILFGIGSGTQNDGGSGAADSDGGTSSPHSLVPSPHSLDSDGDGIPDEWERRTHSDRFSDDSALDLDGDGLNTLEEYWHQTDHRMADTDSDGFLDGEEVDAGMNPLAAENFACVEPDADGNGIIDIWQAEYNLPPLGILYGFIDANGDGWDDRYGAAFGYDSSTNTFDVEVAVVPSRSVLLSFQREGAACGIILPATNRVAVMLQLRFGEENTLRLHSFLPGAEPPTNGLWRAWMGARFVPRTWQGQEVFGNALVTERGAIVHARAVKSEIFANFAAPPPATQAAQNGTQNGTQSGTQIGAQNGARGGMQNGAPRGTVRTLPRGAGIGVGAGAGSDGNGGGILRNGGGGGRAWSGPEIELYEMFVLINSDNSGYHPPDFNVGNFWLVDIVGEPNSIPEPVTWSCEYGDMTPVSGGAGHRSHLRLKRLPSGDDKRVPLVATIKLDEESEAKIRAHVNPCSRREFSFVCADNFSPHLRESLSINVTMPGCGHYNDGGWVEAEIMRQTTSGWQHVGWVDASKMQPGQQDRVWIGGAAHSLLWDGIAKKSAPLADSPAVFTQGAQPFHRALPAVVSGEPVPPPYYTLFVRVRAADSPTAAIIAEGSADVYVPQVVRVAITDAAVAEFNKPIIYPDTYWPHLAGKAYFNGGVSEVLYEGASFSKTELLNKIIDHMQAAFPSDMNIRIVTNSVLGKHKFLNITKKKGSKSEVEGSAGETPLESVSWRNTNPAGEAEAYLDEILYAPVYAKSRVEYHLAYSVVYSSEVFPYQPNDLTVAVASTCIHEIGHTFGLVNSNLGDEKNRHHPSIFNAQRLIIPPVNNWHMNNGFVPSSYKFNKVPEKPRTWKPINAEYLRFILPKPLQKTKKQ